MGIGAAVLSSSSGLAVALLTSARSWRGSGIILARIAQGLADRGHRPHLLGGEVDVVAEFARSGVPATRVLTANTGLHEAWALANVLRGIKADAILVDRPRDLRLAALASLAHPLAIINRYNLSRTVPPRDLLSRLAYRRVRRTVFVSHASAAHALSLAPFLRQRPHRVIHGAVDTELFYRDASAGDTFRREQGLSDRPFALAVGSLTLEKRYDFLLQTWAALLPAAPTLVVSGEGSHGPRLQQRARESGLDVRFPGYLPPENLRGAYSAATCFVHGGAVETFGLSVLEAMTCGCAIVAVRGGAVPEVLGEAGLLAAPSEPAEFAAMVRGLLADPDRRRILGEAACRRAAARFSTAVMQAAYAEVIEDACDAARGAAGRAA